MPNYPTPHIQARPEDFGETVLMPGDPLRSQWIAEQFLRDAVLVNNVRGVQGYTGLYGDTRISVMASGMGMPSMGIYSYELFRFFGVRNIIRIGSAGAIQPEVRLRDIVIAQGASTDSSWAEQYRLPGSFAPLCSFSLLQACVAAAEGRGLPFHVGNLLSSDWFYGDEEGLPQALRTNESWRKMGVLAVEMESAALYMNAARWGGNALAICTVSDHILRGERLTAQERQIGFARMVELALETARRI
ncbi:MAG: purine-nucleoside phosphorylase [Clostridiales bacterium]|nr:purine-nucleoside phosphorylase [Clostridiales bacterium]